MQLAKTQHRQRGNAVEQKVKMIMLRSIFGYGQNKQNTRFSSNGAEKVAPTFRDDIQ
jgi:hypothetical protein